LLRRLNQAPGGTADLVAMRVDLMAAAKAEPDLGRVDLDFRHLFASWFNRGFLVLRRIGWESPANILEKIIAYEAVHEIHSWADLRRRLEPPDRRCFAFFHPAMPDDPLIFVEVALTQGIPGAIGPLLAEERRPLPPGKVDTAVFYSISNCQAGLRGISFGNSLIKQVVDVLGREVAGLKTFVTLSPIPGLSRWIETQDEAARAMLGADPATLEPETLRRLAARYLLEAKAKDGAPLDPVARFHLGNGAEVHEIHASADLSAKGRQQSCGAMVNYLYDPARVEQNHEAFATHQTIAATRGVKALAVVKDRKDKGLKTNG
jgi:malonyl-CoA decarboxylase